MDMTRHILLRWARYGTGFSFRSPLLSCALLAAAAAAGAQETADPAGTLAVLEERIGRLESEQGAYHPGLRPVLLAKGRLHRKQGEVSDAVAAFERALQVSKATYGLHDLRQVAILELLVETHSDSGDLQATGKKLQYLLWIHRRNYETGDDRLVAMMERVGRWYMQAYPLHGAGEAVSYLVRADDLFDEAAAIVAAQHGEASRQLVNILQSTAMINYLIARSVSDVFRMSHRDIRRAMIPNRRGSPYMNEAAVREYYFDQSFYKGRKALRRIIEIHESGLPATLSDYARALVHLGDYNLALDRKWNAMKNYRRAFDVLEEYGAGEQELEAIFGQPRRVEPFVIPGREMPAPDQSRYVDARFDVTRSGWPRDVVILETSPADDSRLKKKGLHSVAAVRFRPRFKNGRPVDTENVSLRYVFRD